MNTTWLSAVLVTAVSVPAQNCNNTSIGAVPLMDLGIGTYQGLTGGLYGNGANTPPPAHQALGVTARSLVVPRDAAGLPAVGGRIVLLSIGMSNTTQEYSTWIVTANGDPNKNPAVTIVDGAQGGQDAVIVANPNANFWTVVDQRLANAGVTPQQVQVVWLKEAIAGVTGGFPGASTQLQGLLAQIARNIRARYPNVQLCFCSSRTYAGYATTSLNPEPYAYESGFAVKWLIEQQINGDPQLNCDPQQGTVLAPWLGWGPYLWTDGTTPRSDGLVWLCADVQPDGTHPSPSGRAKVANLLQQFFTTNNLTVPWYLGGGTTASFTIYGAGCSGTSGVPVMRSNGLPTLGNLNFRIGVESAAPQSIAALWFSGAAAQLPIVGACTLLVDPSTGLPVWLSVTSPLGVRIESLPIPNVPSLAGGQLFCQWLIDDSQGAPLPPLQGLAMSRGARLTLGL
ncbi:MAG TPA: hypothetical protein VFD82_02210 [Planctomycetota bacterium]|nr:hypothetical protein [Planctomycetota bacterium]